MKSRILIAGIVFVVGLGSFLAGRHSRNGSAVTGKRVLYYVDPMHPSYRSDKPGTAPDCGMALEAVYEGEQEFEEQEHSMNSRTVALSGEKRQMLGVQVETLKPASGTQTVVLSGRVMPNENAVYRILAGTDGLVLTLGDNAAGTQVSKDQILATVFTSDFLKAQQTFIFALKTLDRVKSSGHDPAEQIRSAEDQLSAAESELRTFGMSELQIQELSKKRELTREVRIASPTSGVVLARNLTLQQRLSRGEELYRIANLDRVWILADLPQDFPAPAPGSPLRVRIGDGKTLAATVAAGIPLLDSASRTLKLRLAADNPGLILRPDMFVAVQATTHAPRGLSVSRDAIIDSGREKVAYVEVSDGVFEPRTIDAGAVFGDRVIVKSGLKEGDRVVVSGNFMLDSESRMRAPRRLALSMPNPKAEPNARISLAAHTTRDDRVADSKDPVCGMALSAEDVKAAKYTAEHDGRKLVFCSGHCLNKFKNNPDQYVHASGEREMAGADHEEHN
jgi:RND family efflux transporter MFP subunit